VTVSLTAQPSTLKPEFTTGCPKGDGTASCTISSVTAKAPADLQAHIAVAASATSVSSVKLTATARIVTTATWTPPAADETVAVTAAATAPASPSPRTAAPSPQATAMAPAALPLGPLPYLNGQATSLIGAGSGSSEFVGAGDASGLFPAITPLAPTATPALPVASLPQPTKPASYPASGSPVSAEAVPVGTPQFTDEAFGLIVLGLAIILTVTRLSWRRRSRPGGPNK
jgi:hypothetical protein